MWDCPKCLALSYSFLYARGRMNGRDEARDVSTRAALHEGGGVETGGCLENNTSATSEWETWEVRL